MKANNATIKRLNRIRAVIDALPYPKRIDRDQIIAILGVLPKTGKAYVTDMVRVGILVALPHPFKEPAVYHLCRNRIRIEAAMEELEALDRAPLNAPPPVTSRYIPDHEPVHAAFWGFAGISPSPERSAT